MKNLVTFKIKKLNKEKILKEIIKTCEVFNVELNDNFLVFSVRYKFKKTILKILIKNNVEPLDIKGKGLFNYLNNSIFKLSVIIPIILFNIFLFISNFFVFNYNILGINLVNKNEVISVLENNNINGIVKKSDIDIKKITHELQKIDKVSLVSVIIKGHTLLVNIKEKVYNLEYEDKDNFKPIVSNFNGTITEINVVQGTALVNVGQTVKLGQELVSPFIKDTSGNTMQVLPLADIKADVYVTTTTQIPDIFRQMVDTGKSVKTKRVTWGNMIISQDIKECDFKLYRTEVKGEYLVGAILPTKVEYVTYFEQQEFISEDYFDKNKKEILEDCKQKTRQNLDVYDIIKEEYYNISSVAGINTVTYTFVVNKSIC